MSQPEFIGASSLDARNAALLGNEAVAAIERIVDVARREMPLDDGTLRRELQILLRPAHSVRPRSGEAA